MLGEAIAGIYSEAMIEPVPAELRRKYLMRARDRDRGIVRITPQLRSRLFFSRLNLMDDAYPVDDDMDMIFWVGVAGRVILVNTLLLPISIISYRYWVRDETDHATLVT